ncbi:glutathione S-transferase class-mu 26 kDa isozyme 47-like [Argiope bruennichi]|uniref:glutathione transferase n=1 Tax=Argiope bruennichi TaxID=94029 RepID=A0A8T0F4U7_ARGBR|nr:glutathione S-transferase class-mu 26 kDa isozyme 47-like [Argiope bruennichi]KAF8785295.1 Glutathione S-transferase like protein [Argiope bruennichi]
MPKPVVGYWNIRGLVEPIRYILHYNNVDFEDKRYPLSDRQLWEKEKFNLNLDFPNLPYYIDDDVRLTQSVAILRYLAEKYGLDGKTKAEKLLVSLAEQQIIDFRTSFGRLCYDPNFEKTKPEFEKKVPVQLKFVADFLGNRKYLAGDSLTYVDFMAYDTLDYYLYLIPNVFADFPVLKEYHQRIRNLPELQAYLKSSQYQRWPFFSPEAQFGGKGPEPKQE